MESYTSKGYSVKELLKSPKAKYLPEPLEKFFRATMDTTSAIAVELAIDAYEKANRKGITTPKKTTLQHENITALLYSNAATIIPKELLAALLAGKNKVTHEIVNDLIRTIKANKKENNSNPTTKRRYTTNKKFSKHIP